MGEIPNFTDSERLKTPKTDCALKVYKDKEFYQLGLRFVDLENSGEREKLQNENKHQIMNVHTNRDCLIPILSSLVKH